MIRITWHRLRAGWDAGRPRANMLAIAVGYGIFAWSLLWQPRRWALTPAYHNLLAIAPQSAWGIMFAVITALLAAAVYWHEHRWLAMVALSAASAITTTWTAAFVIRWATSGNTTPETWVSWGIFDFILVRALTVLDDNTIRLIEKTGEAPPSPVKETGNG